MRIIYFNGHEVFNWRKIRHFWANQNELIAQVMILTAFIGYVLVKLWT